VGGELFHTDIPMDR